MVNSVIPAATGIGAPQPADRAAATMCVAVGEIAGEAECLALPLEQAANIAKPQNMSIAAHAGKPRRRTNRPTAVTAYSSWLRQG
jgi:hypothetical protein